VTESLVTTARCSVRHCTIAAETILRTRLGLPPRAIVPDGRSILKRVEDFREHGNVATKTLTRRPSVVTPENVERVRVSVEESPRRSTRRRARALGISRRSLQTVSKQTFEFLSERDNGRPEAPSTWLPST